MRAIRDCPKARLLPSRSNLAIFRLASYIRMRSAGPPIDGTRTLLTIDRHQNAFENFSVSLFVVLVAVVYLDSLLSLWMVRPAAIVTAAVLAPVVVEIPFFLAGLVLVPIARRIARRPGANNVDANSAAYMTILLLLSAWIAMGGGAVAVVADVVLMVAGLNAVSACVMWLLRRRVREAEERCGA